jgi:hypothetical protein
VNEPISLYDLVQFLETSCGSGNISGISMVTAATFWNIINDKD